METVDIKVSEGLIKPIIEEKIKLSILEGLGEKDKIIEEVVDKILQTKVDYQGNISKYSSDNKYSMIDSLIRKSIEDATKEAISDFIKEKTDKIKLELRRQLQSRKGIVEFVNAYVDGMVKSSSYNIKMNLEFKT